MKKMKILMLWCMLHSLHIAAQNNIALQSDTLVTKKPVNIWVYTSAGNIVEGKLAGRSGKNLLVYPKAMKKQKANMDYTVERIPYQNITTIQTKKQQWHGGMLKGMLIGGGLGFAPVFGGEAGAYVALLAFPIGLITGAIVGGTSKKKYRIHGNYQPYRGFTDRHLP
jgi:hypothetical protein